MTLMSFPRIVVRGDRRVRHAMIEDYLSAAFESKSLKPVPGFLGGGAYGC
jgi:hypothetical protein